MRETYRRDTRAAHGILPLDSLPLGRGTPEPGSWGRDAGSPWSRASFIILIVLIQVSGSYWQFNPTISAPAEYKYQGHTDSSTQQYQHIQDSNIRVILTVQPNNISTYRIQVSGWYFQFKSNDINTYKIEVSVSYWQFKLKISTTSMVYRYQCQCWQFNPKNISIHGIQKSVYPWQINPESQHLARYVPLKEGEQEGRRENKTDKDKDLTSLCHPHSAFSRRDVIEISSWPHSHRTGNRNSEFLHHFYGPLSLLHIGKEL